MPFQPKPNKSAGSDRTTFYDALHGSFVDARREMHLARKSIGTAEWKLKERTQARNNAYTKHSTLYCMAKKGELTSSLFKQLNDAGDELRYLSELFSEAEAELVATRKGYAARSESFWQAKRNCESSGCPEQHDLPGTAAFSREEHMARKAAKEEQQRGWKQDKENLDKEARQRRAFEKATKKPAPAAKPKQPAKRPAGKPATYTDWIATSKAAFKDYASLSKFPSPPPGRVQICAARQKSRMGRESLLLARATSSRASTS